MMLIDFETFSLTEMLKGHSFNKFRFVNEINSQHQGVRCKQLDFMIKQLELGARILIIEQDSSVEIQVHFENVCKNIDISDHTMDTLIAEMSEIAELVKIALMKEPLVNEKLILTRSSIKLDSLLFLQSPLNLEDDVVDLALAYVENSNHQYLEDTHYPYSLILFGRMGLYVAEALKAAEMADYNRQNSGYRIKFNKGHILSGGASVVPIAQRFSEIGVSAVAIPLSIYSYFW